MQSATTATRRRTQSERSAATRSQLLDAAIECLVAYGYAGTTTTRVAERAGVSRGAQLHHYPTRAELVAAAAEHLFVSLTAEYRHAFERLEADVSLTAAIELLWSMFDRPSFGAVIELHTAARTDTDLRDCLEPVSAGHTANVGSLAARYFPTLAIDPSRLEGVLSLVTNAMHGMVASRLVHGRDPVGEREQLALLVEAVTALVGSAAPARPAASESSRERS